MNTREQAIEIIEVLVPVPASSPDGNFWNGQHLVAAEIVDALIAANLFLSVSPATAWDEGFDASEVWSSSQPGESMPTNPYRSPATTKGN